MKTQRISLILAVLCLCSFFVATAFAATDNVLSANIKEADGTTGQDTNTGSGVKAGHIQDGAVTTGKIADGSVTISKISDGAVTDAKITGPISASKISSVGLNADTVDGQHASDFASAVHTHSQAQVTGLDAALAGKSDVTHNHDTLYQQKYGKVAVVAQTGGDYTNPAVAMNDVTSWCGTPSASNPCLLKIMPGVYNVGSNPVQMKPYVDVEGSGINITKINGNVTSPNGTSGLINGASNSEIRLLTVQNTATVGTVIGIRNFGGAFQINNMSIIASGGVITIGIIVDNNTNAIIKNTAVTADGTGSVQSISIYYSSATLTDVQVTTANGFNSFGIDNLSSTTQMENVTVTATGGNFATGVQTRESSATTIMTNSSVTASNASQSYGISDWFGSNTKIDRSSIAGSTNAINIYGNSTTDVAYTKVEGGIVNNSATLRCIGLYDGGYNPYTCP